MVTDDSAITAAVDFGSVGVAVLAVGALLAAPLVIRKGAWMLLDMIEGRSTGEDDPRNR